MCRITLAAPAQRNVINGAVAHDFLAALTEAEADLATSAILIDAEGSTFCGGLDFADPPPDEFFAEPFAQASIVAAIQGWLSPRA